jgi:hypothetical protein
MSSIFTLIARVLVACFLFVFFGLGFVFEIQTLLGSLVNFSDDAFFKVQGEELTKRMGGIPEWISAHPANTAIRDLLYRSSLFHIHVWSGSLWFLLVPVQIWGRGLVGNTIHKWMGRILLLCFVGGSLIVVRTIAIFPLGIRDAGECRVCWSVSLHRHMCLQACRCFS